MKKILAGCLLALPLLVAGCAHPVIYPPPPPPPNFSPYGQQGFHDGFVAAEQDIQHGRRPRPARHPRFRNPPVPYPAWEDYRHGFRRGYEVALRPPPPPPPPQ